MPKKKTKPAAPKFPIGHNVCVYAEGEPGGMGEISGFEGTVTALETVEGCEGFYYTVTAANGRIEQVWEHFLG